ncbi:hypothetical protein [Paracoccus sp. (in: a-proteobacteria)]|uniref:hypothetical protein n=1 Tax=Paracoccus sp. TaxID=267 RepID=UPI00396C7E01
MPTRRELMLVVGGYVTGTAFGSKDLFALPVTDLVAPDTIIQTNLVKPVRPVKGSVAIGMAGIADWGASQPFIDIMKQSREWQGRSEKEWESHSHQDLRAGGHLDAESWPVSIPSSANRVGTIILTQIAADDTSLNGRYRVTWEGTGTLTVSGGQNLDQGVGWVEFDYTATGESMVLVDVTATPVRNIRCINLKHRAAYEAGEIFRPEWLALIENFRLFRFMDWQSTNNSPLSSWADRPKLSSATWSLGVPVEIMVALCNKAGVDGWFCFPHLATDDYIIRFAQYIQANLRDDLVAYYEYSNEVWNFQFEQAHWANQQAEALWPDHIGQDGWMQFYGGRSAEMAMLLDGVYAGTMGRHRKVITTHTAWRGLEYGILDAPRWVAMQAGRKAPKDHFDCYAVTGYFGHGLSAEDGTAQIQTWRQQGEMLAFQQMRAALEDEITGLQGQWQYQKDAADAAGLSLVMYEGGSHIVPHHSTVDADATLLPFLERFHYSEDMAALYTRAMTAFRDIGGEFFNVFVEVSGPGRHGFWGARRHVMDENPRWTAVTMHNRVVPR